MKSLVAFVASMGGTINPPAFSRRKQGGIWFIRLWRVRVSFCLARAQS